MCLMFSQATRYTQLLSAAAAVAIFIVAIVISGCVVLLIKVRPRCRIFILECAYAVFNLNTKAIRFQEIKR